MLDLEEIKLPKLATLNKAFSKQRTETELIKSQSTQSNFWQQFEDEDPYFRRASTIKKIEDRNKEGMVTSRNTFTTRSDKSKDPSVELFSQQLQNLASNSDPLSEDQIL